MRRKWEEMRAMPETPSRSCAEREKYRHLRQQRSPVLVKKKNDIICNELAIVRVMRLSLARDAEGRLWIETGQDDDEVDRYFVDLLQYPYSKRS